MYFVPKSVKKKRETRLDFFLIDLSFHVYHFSEYKNTSCDIILYIKKSFWMKRQMGGKIIIDVMWDIKRKGPGKRERCKVSINLGYEVESEYKFRLWTDHYMHRERKEVQGIYLIFLTFFIYKKNLINLIVELYHIFLVTILY